MATKEQAIRKYEEDIRSQQAAENYCKRIAQFLEVPEDVVCQSLPAQHWKQAVQQPNIGERWFENYKSTFLSKG